MIRHLLHQNIDKKKWDNCIRNSVSCNLYAESLVLDFFSENWEALVEDDYVSVMPLTKGMKYGIDYLFHPIVLQQLGVFSTNELNADDVNRFLDSIPSKYRLVDIFLNQYNRTSIKDFEIKNNQNFELNLAPEYQEQFSKYSENHQRNIKKCAKEGMNVKYDADPEIIMNQFIKTKGQEISTYSSSDYNKMLSFMIYFANLNRTISLTLISHEQELIASVFFLLSKGRITYLKGSANENGRRIGAMHFLFDIVIKENSGKQLLLDFGGSNIPSLAKFYAGFGAQETTYLHVKRNKLPWPLNWIKK